MFDRRDLFFLFAASATAAAIVALRRNEPPQPAGPFERGMSATGYVEEIETHASGCVACIALYDWHDLSLGYPLEEMPLRNDRVHVLGSRSDFDALIEARTISEGHVAFQIGMSASQWFFMEPPEPGLGCGGFIDDWAPGPVGRVY